MCLCYHCLTLPRALVALKQPQTIQSGRAWLCACAASVQSQAAHRIWLKVVDLQTSGVQSNKGGS